MPEGRERPGAEVPRVAAGGGKVAERDHLPGSEAPASTAVSGGPQQGVPPDGDSDDDMLSSDEEGEEAEDAKLHVRKIAHTGGINRVRSMISR